MIALYGLDYFIKDNLFLGWPDFVLSTLLPALAVMLFWVRRQATPGKMVVRARVVDATTGGPISGWQALARYLGYIVSTLPAFLGFLWVAFDRRKRGWHDLLAGTVVIREKRARVEPVNFHALAPAPAVPASPPPSVVPANRNTPLLLLPLPSPASGVAAARRAPLLAIVLGLVAWALMLWAESRLLQGSDADPDAQDTNLRCPYRPDRAGGAEV